jgi:hypothetical protein
VSGNSKADDIARRRRAAAQRALAEAEERRRSALPQTEAPREIGGRKGPDPTRFGDWEKDGIAVDF